MSATWALLLALGLVKFVYQMHDCGFGNVALARQPAWVAALLLLTGLSLWAIARATRRNPVVSLALLVVAGTCLIFIELFFLWVYPALKGIPATAHIRFTSNAGVRMRVDGRPLSDWRIEEPGPYTHFPANAKGFWGLGRPDDPDVVAEYPTDENGLKNIRGEYTRRNRFDVVTVGDSFTEGMGTSLEDSWPQRLQGLLERSVYNLGGGGSGPIEQSAALDALAWQKHPSVVLWGFLEGNDFEDAENMQRELSERARRSQPAPLWKRAWRAFGGAVDGSLALDLPFALYRTLKYRAGTSGAADGYLTLRTPRGTETVPFNYYVKNKSALRDSAGLQVFRERFTYSVEKCKATGSKMVLVFFPNKAHAYLPRLSEGERRAMAPFVANIEAKRELVLEVCRNLGVPMIDLVPPFQALKEPYRAYFRVDGHMNAEGNRLVAQYVAAELRKRRL